MDRRFVIGRGARTAPGESRIYCVLSRALPVATINSGKAACQNRLLIIISYFVASGIMISTKDGITAVPNSVLSSRPQFSFGSACGSGRFFNSALGH
jgi:hypothetical protein